MKFLCSVLALDVDVHNYRPLLRQSERLCILEILFFFFFVRIFGVCKSDKIILGIFSSKRECLDNNQRRHEYREVFLLLLFSGLGFFGLKLNKK